LPAVHQRPDPFLLHSPLFAAVTPWLAEIEYFVRAQKTDVDAAAPEAPVLRLALCNHYPLTITRGMYKTSDLGRPTETRLALLETIDTKCIIARPTAEAPAAYFIPYSNVSGMR
jgi:hypothetical protein